MSHRSSFPTVFVSFFNAIEVLVVRFWDFMCFGASQKESVVSVPRGVGLWLEKWIKIPKTAFDITHTKNLKHDQLKSETGLSAFLGNPSLKGFAGRMFELSSEGADSQAVVALLLLGGSCLWSLDQSSCLSMAKFRRNMKNGTLCRYISKCRHTWQSKEHLYLLQSSPPFWLKTKWLSSTKNNDTWI